jgi:hypothetical protein
MKKLPADFEYLPDMYQDGYFPNFLVDKIKAEIVKVVAFFEEGDHSTEPIQEALDQMTVAINGLQDKFLENDSEIETGLEKRSATQLKRYLSFTSLTSMSKKAIREQDW